MKLILSLIFSLIIFSSFAAQTKYLIYFKDKGIENLYRLNKNSQMYLEAEKQLSYKAIERRKQILGEDNYITFEDLPINEEYIKQIEMLGVKIIHKLKWFNAVSCYLTEAQLTHIKNFSFVNKIERARTLYNIKPVEEKEPSNFQNQLLNKSSFSLNYGLSLKQNLLSDIPVVHDLGINGKGVLIGLLDTGFRWKTHPSLKNAKVIAEKDFIQNDDITANDSSKGDATNQDKHGTAVFSIIGGYDPGNLIGPAYGSEFILAKTEYVPTETHIEEDNYAAALEWMEALGVDITSSSLGYNEFDASTYSYTYRDMNGSTTIVAKAANLAFERGVSTFTAAGNEGNTLWGEKEGGNNFGKIVSPADAFNIISVGAVDTSNSVVAFSSRGPTSDGRIKPEIVALGSRVLNAVSGGTYAFGSGTSYATPIAAGIAALLKSAYPHLTNYQIRQIMLESGDNSQTPDYNRGYGLISARRAVTFPNLNKIGNQFVINKIFIDSSNIKPNSVTIHYNIGNNNTQSAPMIYDGHLRYTFNLPLLINNQKISFYFTYENSSKEVREPINGNYEFDYGSLLIHYNVFNVEEPTNIEEPSPKNYYLYNNYPNPFNNETRIEFYSVDNSYAELIIYNLLGQKVKTIFSGASLIGKNVFRWNGENDFGGRVTSGPYFYVLRINGNIFSKKMIYMK